MNTKVIRTIVTATAFAATMTSSALLTQKQIGVKCGGSDRWDVKTLHDDGRLRENVKKTTIANLHAIERPEDLGKDSQRQPAERQVYKLERVRISHKLPQADDDVHLVFVDEKDETLQVIGEIPYFDCPDIVDKDLKKLYRQARINLLAEGRNYKKVYWNVVGVAFFDLPHHGNSPKGEAPNIIELHPILQLEAIGD